MMKLTSNFWVKTFRNVHIFTIRCQFSFLFSKSYDLGHANVSLTYFIGWIVCRLEFGPCHVFEFQGDFRLKVWHCYSLCMIISLIFCQTDLGLVTWSRFVLSFSHRALLCVSGPYKNDWRAFLEHKWNIHGVTGCRKSDWWRGGRWQMWGEELSWREESRLCLGCRLIQSTWRCIVSHSESVISLCILFNLFVSPRPSGSE